MGYIVSRVDKKRILLRRLPGEFDGTTETIMASDCDFHEAITRLTVQESCIKQSEEKIESASVMRGVKSGRTFYKRGKKVHTSIYCRQNNKGSEKDGKREPSTCFQWGKREHIAKDCHSRNATSKNTRDQYCNVDYNTRGLVYQGYRQPSINVDPGLSTIRA